MPAKTCSPLQLKLVVIASMDDEWLTRLDEAIKADGRTPRAISIAAGFGPNYLSEVFKGKIPAIDKLVRLCSELNVSVTYMLTGAQLSAEGEEYLSILKKLDPEGQKAFLALARRMRSPSQP